MKLMIHQMIKSYDVTGDLEPLPDLSRSLISPISKHLHGKVPFLPRSMLHAHEKIIFFSGDMVRARNGTHRDHISGIGF